MFVDNFTQFQGFCNHHRDVNMQNHTSNRTIHYKKNFKSYGKTLNKHNG
jgi:hypothetical protein